ncbi:hypothetical protein TRVL_05649 [Trypanosoma vivax]|uniref:Uncharacterized protein n=1 Tax=Trypanosoma vivax (strain Y486) TaxID=1055687 RepID=G0TTY7_TRYVY|nr:hypothetical protein TRVL_05649 [Trypanosoma vivax]CCC47420.1 hypothetical protein TVY486_0400850 [Trypanosoma vivax Y486]
MLIRNASSSRSLLSRNNMGEANQIHRTTPFTTAFVLLGCFVSVLPSLMTGLKFAIACSSSVPTYHVDKTLPSRVVPKLVQKLERVVEEAVPQNVCTASAI